jgi:hypothetical protein
MNLSPGFDQALLWPRHAAAETLKRIERKDSGIRLVVDVDVWPLMRSTRLDIHSNHDAKKTRELRH